jgi:hypothetical protein
MCACCARERMAVIATGKTAHLDCREERVLLCVRATLVAVRPSKHRLAHINLARDLGDKLHLVLPLRIICHRVGVNSVLDACCSPKDFAPLAKVLFNVVVVITLAEGTKLCSTERCKRLVHVSDAVGCARVNIVLQVKRALSIWRGGARARVSVL